MPLAAYDCLQLGPAVRGPVRQQADPDAFTLSHQPGQAEDIYELAASCLVAPSELGIEQPLRPP